MNIKEPKFTEQFNFKLSPEMRLELEHLFGKQNLSGKIREYLTQAIEKDKKKGKFQGPVKPPTKLEKLTAILGLHGEAGARRLQRFKKDYKVFSELVGRYLEHSEFYSQEAKKAFICYSFELDYLPEDKDIEELMEYLDRG